MTPLSRQKPNPMWERCGDGSYRDSLLSRFLFQQNGNEGDRKKKKEGVREDRKVMRPCDKKVTHRIGKYKYLSRFIVVFVISHIEPGQVYDYAVSL